MNILGTYVCLNAHMWKAWFGNSVPVTHRKLTKNCVCVMCASVTLSSADQRHTTDHVCYVCQCHFVLGVPAPYDRSCTLCVPVSLCPRRTSAIRQIMCVMCASVTLSSAYQRHTTDQYDSARERLGWFSGLRVVAWCTRVAGWRDRVRRCM
jgi:hypothetical protein